MSRPRIVPDKNTLRGYLDAGMTHQEIADLVNAQTGETVGRTAIAAAAARYGLSKSRPRFKDEVPWVVDSAHLSAYPVIMLRLLGRRNNNISMSKKLSDQLDSWLRTLDKNGWIVAYDPDSDPGFVYVDKKFKDHKKPIPIRKKIIHLNPAESVDSEV